MIIEKDRRILQELEENSRASVRDIAKNTGIRASTVHNRIRHMKENGVIERFTVKLDNQKSGQNFIVYLLVSSGKDISASVFRKKYVKEVMGITGEYDLMLKCKFKDIEEFNSFIIEFRKDKNIIKTHSLVVTTTIKEEV